MFYLVSASPCSRFEERFFSQKTAIRISTLGTSTGGIIAALLALGRSVKEINDLYEKHVPIVMQKKGRHEKSLAFAKRGDEVFKEDKFDKMKIGVGIVATRWVIERPMIFKTSIEHAHGRMGTFSPGFGVKGSDAVQASCSAFPFFERKMVKTDKGDLVEPIDGGYYANNPTLYAIADALVALKLHQSTFGSSASGWGYIRRRNSRGSAPPSGRRSS